jgi:hypothetical protein
LLLALSFSTGIILAQPVYEHVNHQGIYHFLDELANMGVIELNSAIKPYTRSLIREKLAVASEQKEVLNPRQQEMLAFYNQAFRTTGEAAVHDFNLKQFEYFYHDENFTMQVRPVLGVAVLGGATAGERMEMIQYHRHNGAEFWASIQGNWGIYANLRDNFNSKNLVTPEYLINETGALYKTGNDSTVEFSEMRAGIIYGNRWITAGLVKDHLSWGNNYHGANIFTPKSPSLVQIKLNIRPVPWLEFNYFHAWLNSDVIDSSKAFTYTNAYGTRKRFVYREKYMAANMVTIKPWKSTYVSFGNSIIYADIGLQPAYLIPFAFYKSIDHTLNSTSNAAGQNAQMFLDVSTRRVKGLHLFTTLFIDELAITDMFDQAEHSNCISLKSGFRASNFPLAHLHLTGEYTRSNPLAYQHFTPTTTFESNRYNFGHYLRDNAEELYVAITYEPFSRFRGEVSYCTARKGPDYDAIGGRRRGLPFMSEVRWERSEFTLSLDYQLFYNAYGRIAYQYTRTDGPDAGIYHPQKLLGKKHLLGLQLSVGI